MIPSSKKPRFKPLVKLQKDVWNNLIVKKLHKKKWETLRERLKRTFKNSKSTKYGKKKIVHNYASRALLKFRNYLRYKYQKKLFMRQTIKLIYGSLQDYKIKYMARNSKTYIHFIRHFEQKPFIFLHRSNLISTISEGVALSKKKDIIINGNPLQKYVKKGDIMHFSRRLEKVLRIKLVDNLNLYNVSKTTKKNKKLRHKFIYKQSKYSLSTNVDDLMFDNNAHYKKIKLKLFNNVHFDLTQFRFHFLNDITYFRNHPFFIPFQRVWRYYSRV